MITLRDVARELSRRFSTMTYDEIEILEDLILPMHFKKGEPILREGEVSQYIYYLHSGLIRQYYHKNNKDMTSFLGVDGDMFMSVESLFHEMPSHEGIEALEPCSVFAIPKRRLEFVALHNQNLQILYRKILEEALISHEARADMLRFESAQDRYRRISVEMPQVVLRAPLVYIASFLQMTPETLSRVRGNTLVV